MRALTTIRLSTRPTSRFRPGSVIYAVLLLAAGFPATTRAESVPFRRGDANADGAVDPTDGIVILTSVLLEPKEPPCLRAADTNDDGLFDVTDGIGILTYVFLGREPPPAPGPDRCGLDSTEDSLHCRAYAPCAVISAPPPPPSGPLQVFLAPTGDDASDGLSVQTSILTLARAQEIIRSQPPIRDFEVLIAAGRYFGQTVEWDYALPDRTITFKRLDPDGPRPVFDGCRRDGSCPGGVWFHLRDHGLERTNIHFSYIRVERYEYAIALRGGGFNRIYGCYFFDIGNDFNPALGGSTSAVGITSSDDNEIVNSHFVHIVNHPDSRRYSPASLHAIYVAHRSDRNQILRNRFYDGSGDPVRIRDYSNHNTVNGNVFTQTGITAGYTEWYRERDECPSWDNHFRDNVLDGNYECERLYNFYFYQDDFIPGCTRPFKDVRRLRTGGNTRTESPCSL